MFIVFVSRWRTWEQWARLRPCTFKCARDWNIGFAWGGLWAIIVGVMALVIVYVFITQAAAMGAAIVFVLVGVLVAALIVLNVGRALLRGY